MKDKANPDDLVRKLRMILERGTALQVKAIAFYINHLFERVLRALERKEGGAQ